jgi:hypothetical protein
MLSIIRDGQAQDEMKERTFQDATAAVLQSVPRSRRHVGLIRSILQPRPLHLKLGMLCNMLKILVEIILDEKWS